MAFLPKDETASLVSIKLTDKGREFLAKGFKDDNVFDVVKFSLGDSEVDYTQTADGITGGTITEPTNNPVDLKSKLFASGVVPDGASAVNLSTTQVSMTAWQSGIGVSVNTTWEPITGIYLEEYSWTNLGPLEDYDFGIATSNDTRSATLRSYDTTGTTTVKVEGMTSGKYALFTITIS